MVLVSLKHIKMENGKEIVKNGKAIRERDVDGMGGKLEDEDQ